MWLALKELKSAKQRLISTPEKQFWMNMSNFQAKKPVICPFKTYHIWQHALLLWNWKAIFPISLFYSGLPFSIGAIDIIHKEPFKTVTLSSNFRSNVWTADLLHTCNLCCGIQSYCGLHIFHKNMTTNVHIERCGGSTHSVMSNVWNTEKKPRPLFQLCMHRRSISICNTAGMSEIYQYNIFW